MNSQNDSHNVDFVLNRLMEATNTRSYKDLADLMDISTTVIANWKSRNKLNYDKIISFCEEKGLSLDFIISKSERKGGGNTKMVSEPLSEYGSERVPLYDVEASAGAVAVFDDLFNQKPVDNISIPDMPRVDGAVYIRGDSMYPILKSGDIVAYKIMHDKKFSFVWGEMYLLSIDMEGDVMFTAKYVQKSENPEYIRLVSHNPHHQDFEVHLDNIKSFAIIKLSIRKHTI